MAAQSLNSNAAAATQFFRGRHQVEFCQMKWATESAIWQLCACSLRHCHRSSSLQRGKLCLACKKCQRQEAPRRRRTIRRLATKAWQCLARLSFLSCASYKLALCVRKLTRAQISVTLLHHFRFHNLKLDYSLIWPAVCGRPSNALHCHHFDTPRRGLSLRPFRGANSAGTSRRRSNKINSEIRLYLYSLQSFD